MHSQHKVMKSAPSHKIGNTVYIVTLLHDILYMSQRKIHELIALKQ